MPEYATLKSHYAPMSFQELMLIPSMYKQSYDEAMKQYNEIEDKAAIIRSYAKESPTASKMLEDYDNGVKGLAEAMSSGRWSSQMAQDAMNLREAYRKDIIPIQTGITSYQAAIERRNKKDDGTIIGNPLSLDDYIVNPNLQDDFMVGSAIEKEAMQSAAMLASMMKRRTPWKTDRGGQYWVGQEITGFTQAEKEAWLQNKDDERFAQLKAIENQIKDKYGYDNMTTEMREKFDSYVTRGIYDGMTGKVDIKEAANRGYSAGGGGGKEKTSKNPLIFGLKTPTTTKFDFTSLDTKKLEEQIDKSKASKENKEKAKKEIQQRNKGFRSFCQIFGIKDNTNLNTVFNQNVLSYEISSDSQKQELFNMINGQGYASGTVVFDNDRFKFNGNGKKVKLNENEFKKSNVEIDINPFVSNIMTVRTTRSGKTETIYITPDRVGLSSNDIYDNLYQSIEGMQIMQNSNNQNEEQWGKAIELQNNFNDKIKNLTLFTDINEYNINSKDNR